MSGALNLTVVDITPPADPIFARCIGAERIERNTDDRFEVWRAVVDGHEVMATISYDEFSAQFGAMPFRDFVVAKLLQAAGDA